MKHLAAFDRMKYMSYAELDAIMRAGVRPDAKSLPGTEWRGWSPAPWIALLGIRKFMKGFFLNETSSIVEGYNVPMRQDGPEVEWTAKAPPFGFYHVVPPAPPDDLHPNSLLIDYGVSARNAFWKPERRIRDYICLPDPKEPDFMLGKAVIALGAARIQTSFFLLEKRGETDWRP